MAIKPKPPVKSAPAKAAPKPAPKAAAKTAPKPAPAPAKTKAPAAAAPAQAKHVKTEQTTLNVTRTLVEGEGEAVKTLKDDTTITITPFATDTAKISVGSKRKVSDGNYGSTEVSIMLTVPCYVEEIDDVYTQVTQKVEELMTKELESLNLTAGVPEGEAEAEVEGDAEEAGAEEAEGEGEPDTDTPAQTEVTEQDILNMDRPTLVTLIEDNGLGHSKENPEGIKYKTIKNLDALKKAVLEAIGAGDAEGEATEEDAGAEEEATEYVDEDGNPVDEDGNPIEEVEEATPEEEEAEAEAEGYTDESLKAMDLDDLREIAKAWELKVKIPANANDAVKKKSYIATILAAQSQA